MSLLIHRIRFQDDDYQAPDEPTYTTPDATMAPTAGTSGDSSSATPEAGGQEGPPKKLSANFIPVIAIMMASKMIPALDTVARRCQC